ncbi:MAG: dipeptide epimerase [Deltaproteobacteria bacterium]|jgi:L-Ala-D/L-Glu epimerase|nr:dipeptide epimerase [Deltaproteobacteria bacterium]MBT4525511.1 dipeptide epimerase [Deltaproteobacteria bacterium]
MKILDIRTGFLSIPMKKPFKTALRTVDKIENIVVVIKTDTDSVGYGDAAPTAVITGDTVQSIQGAISHIRQHLIGQEIQNLELVCQIIRTAIVGNTSAKAALDMAVYDLWGKLHHAPLFRLLGGFRNELITDYTISIDTPEKMAAESLEMVGKGFSILKTKVGGNIQTDIQRLKAIRNAVGPDIKIRVDANQGWRPKEAVYALQQLQVEGVHLELMEQPVNRKDFIGMQFICKHSHTPVFADESAFSPEDVQQLIQMKAADGINIKLMKCGGIHEALKITALIETAGLKGMVGSMMEGPIGVTAITHLAMAKSVISSFDLDAPLFLKENPFSGGIRYTDSKVQLTDLPGLGVYNIEAHLQY